MLRRKLGELAIVIAAFGPAALLELLARLH